MKLITTSQLRKTKTKMELDDETLVVCAMNTELEMDEDGESRAIDFTISSETEDSYRDIVKADGWDLERYLKNPVVLWAHIRQELPIGKASNIRTDGTALKATAEFAARDVYAFADDVFKMLRAKFLNAVSVGFIPQEWSWDEQRGGYNFIKSELYEFSVVPVPANPDALANAIETGEDLGPIREWTERLLDEWRPEGHMALWVPREKIEDIHKIVSGNAMITSWTFSGSDPGAEASNVTVADVPELTASDAFHEFWEPFDGTPIPDPADKIKTPSDTDEHVNIMTPTDQRVTEALDRFSGIVEGLTKTVESLVQDKPVQKITGQDTRKLVIELDEEDRDDIGDQLEAFVSGIRVEEAVDDDDFDIDPEALRMAIKAEAEKAIMNRTGKLPKEV